MGLFDKETLLAAFDRIGKTARENGVMLDIAVYGGSALMLASNFRIATEDVHIAEFQRPWPEWFSRVVDEIGDENDWGKEWLNDAVQFHLSPLADRASDHHEFGTFPRNGAPGLRVSVPPLAYMLALKLKAMRILDPAKGTQESDDIRNLLLAGNVQTPDDAIKILGRFFPKSAKEPDKQRFFLKHIWPQQEPSDVTPEYPISRRP